MIVDNLCSFLQEVAAKVVQKLEPCEASALFIEVWFQIKPRIFCIECRRYIIHEYSWILNTSLTLTNLLYLFFFYRIIYLLFLNFLLYLLFTFLHICLSIYIHKTYFMRGNILESEMIKFKPYNYTWRIKI